MADPKDKFMHIAWTPANSARCVSQLEEIPDWATGGLVWTASEWRSMALRMAARLNTCKAGVVQPEALIAIGSFLVGRPRTVELGNWIRAWIGANIAALREGVSVSMPYEQEKPPDRLLMPARVVRSEASEADGKRFVTLTFTVIGGRFFGRTYNVRFPSPSRSYNRLVFKFGVTSNLLAHGPFWPRAFVGMAGMIAVRKGMVCHVEAPPAIQTQNRKLWTARGTKCGLGLKLACSKCSIGIDKCPRSSEPEDHTGSGTGGYPVPLLDLNRTPAAKKDAGKKILRFGSTA